MSVYPDRTESCLVAGAVPDAAVVTAPMSSREEERYFRLRIWVWGKRFAGRLKANAQRIKQFLHSGT